MRTKNKPAMTALERAHVDLVAQLPCSICDAAGPSEVHEPEQGLWFCSIALCPDCHRGSRNGLHGQRQMWTLGKQTEWTALAITLRRVAALREAETGWRRR